jgi:peptide/nickel transport system permease protein
MKNFRRVILRKALNSFITLMLVIVINFLLFRMMPGDPLKFMVPPNPRFTEEYLLQLAEDYGLNDPPLEQFITYIEGVFTLDFGYSFEDKSALAMDHVLDYMRWTIVLVGVSSIFMISIGMLIGIIAAWKRGSKFDTGSLIFSLFFYAMPTFWLAMMMVVIFGLTLEIFPTSRGLDVGTTFDFSFDAFVDLIRHLVLPAATLTLVNIAAFSLLMRGSLSDVMTEDYIQTARAKGMSESEVLKNHAVPNAMLPMVALIAITIAYIVGGAFQVEFVFDYPGVGWATVEAVMKEDWPVLQAAFFLIALAVIVANLLADIMMVYLDPRVDLE